MLLCFAFAFSPGLATANEVPAETLRAVEVRERAQPVRLRGRRGRGDLLDPQVRVVSHIDNNNNNNCVEEWILAVLDP